MNLKEAQKRAYKNKIDKGFNVTNIEEEFCLIYGEIAELFEAYRKKQNDVGEELADVVIYLLGLAEILKVDLADEIEKKMLKNQNREYKIIDGVNTRIKD